MAKNHLEYGYLEGECVGERFTEDPVSITVFAKGLKDADKKARLFVRYVIVASKWGLSRWINKRKHKLRAIIMLLMNPTCTQRCVGAPHPCDMPSDFFWSGALHVRISWVIY